MAGFLPKWATNTSGLYVLVEHNNWKQDHTMEVQKNAPDKLRYANMSKNHVI